MKNEKHYEINIHSSEYMIREVDTSDSWDIGETGLDIGGVSLVECSAARSEITALPGTPFYIVVEHYRDGCTFGSSEYAEVRQFFADKAKAQAYMENSAPPSHGYFGHHIEFLMFEAIAN